MKSLLIPLSLLLFQPVLAQRNLPSSNTRIFPSSITQTEPVIAVDPGNPSVMFASAVTINTRNGFRSEGVYVTTDGGISWAGTDSCKGEFVGNHGGDPGVAIHPGGKFILMHIGWVFYGVYSHYSTDRGSTWSEAATITSDLPEDKGTSTIDNDPSSPFYGRIYSTWVNYLQPYPVLISYSSDSGKSWAPPAAINGTPPEASSGGFVKTGPGGKVYVCWAGLPDVFPFQEDFTGFAVSSNGGATWAVTQNAFTMNGIAGTLPAKSGIRVNGLPRLDVDRSDGPRRGWIYIVTAEKDLAPAGSDPDIILHRSSDGGASWSGGIRVNQDSINNGRIQYFPEILVDSSGGLNIVYYDDRYVWSDSSSEIMLSRSMDGGTTWTEHIISDHTFKPKPIIGGSTGYQGDHIALAATGHMLHAFWMDDYSGLYQVWSAVVDLSTLGTPPDRGGGVPEAFGLDQNYPNPFNPGTVLRYKLPVESRVSLKVYDLTGREIAVLVGRIEGAGAHEIPWNGKDLASGVYFCMIEARGVSDQTKVFTQVRKMLLVR